MKVSYLASRPAGPVHFTWSPGHQIQDLASIPHRFAGTGWDCQLNPDARSDQVVINEMLAWNQNTNRLTINRSTVLRAGAFKTNCLTSVPLTHTYLLRLSEAMRSLPVISLITDSNHLAGPSGILGISGGTYVSGAWQSLRSGDYNNLLQHGPAWERPVSAEYLRPQDNRGFQVDCGLRVHSSDWFRPRLRSDSKFSFRLWC